MRINSDPSSPASNTISAIPANAAEPNHGHNIPTDLLTTLLASISDLKSSVNSLQGSISKLQYENKGLREELQSTKTDLMILRENSDVRFPQFSKLPAELRR
jgi:TolA-binding protein